MKNGGWIKVFRTLEEWQWWYDEKMVKFFLYLIFNACTKDCYVGTTLVPRGSFITSYEKMAKGSGFSVMQVRNMVDKLISTSEITKFSTSKNTMITVNNYNRYQSDNKENNKQTTSKATNKQQTNNNIIRNKEYNPTDYKEEEERAAAQEPFSSEEAEPDEPKERIPYAYEAAGFSSWEEYDQAIKDKWG